MEPPPLEHHQNKSEILYFELQEKKKSLNGSKDPKLLQEIQEIENELLDLALVEPELWV